MGIYEYFRDFIRFNFSNDHRFPISWFEGRIILNEDTPKTSFDRHYFYHPAWAARVLAKSKPKTHIDISSTLNFCAVVSAFVPVKFYDYRPPNLKLPNLSVESIDLTALPFKSSSVKSLSCMHVVEHIGLGRYGDKLDVNGDLKAIEELKRVLAPGGFLLFVVPVGEPKIIFNAHRIYSLKQIKSYFSGFTLQKFAIIADKGNEGLIINPSEKFCNQQKYACGCFWFKK